MKLKFLFVLLTFSFNGIRSLPPGKTPWYAPPIRNNSYRCILPKLEPWAEEMKPFIKTPEPFKCLEAFPLLFESNLTHLIPQNLQTFKASNIRECCYQKVQRLGDYGFGMGLYCLPLSLSTPTKMNSSLHYVLIKCKKFRTNQTVVMDVHAFPMDMILNEKKHDRRRRTKHVPVQDGGTKLNVIVLGMDSMSQMNFQRTMPRSHDFLVKNLSAIRMKGYNRIDQFSAANLRPLLTNLTEPEYATWCQVPNFCRHIWNTYSDSGYVTGYAEDVFFFQGFILPPTDIYMKPYVLALQTHGASDFRSYGMCGGPRNWLEVLLNLLKKVIEGVIFSNRRPLFYYTYDGGLAHDDISVPMNADGTLFAFLQWLKGTVKEFLDKTLLILVSDHGLDNSQTRSTCQGKMESNNPILYFVLPPCFKVKYPKAHRNLVGNSERLTTAFDVYQTLEDLSNGLEPLQDKKVELEEGKLRAEDPFRRGINLFFSVPEMRTCQDASINPLFCFCKS